MEYTVISRKIDDELSEWETILQIGDEQFLLSNPEGMHLAMSKEEAENLKNRLIKAFSSIGLKEKIKEPYSNKCNFHTNCREANEIAKSRGKLWAEHCSDEFCEDCFGK